MASQSGAFALPQNEDAALERERGERERERERGRRSVVAAVNAF